MTVETTVTETILSETTGSRDYCDNRLYSDSRDYVTGETTLTVDNCDSRDYSDSGNS